MKTAVRSTAARMAPPSEAFRLRDYSPRDLERLCLLDRRCFPEKIAYPPETMREAIEESGAFGMIAEDESGSIAAFIVAGRTSPRVGHIATIDVAPEVRRRGLGRRLMQAAEQRLADLGVRKIRLETATGNAARRLFEQLGYKRTGKIERYYQDGSNAWVMEKIVGITRRPVVESLPPSQR
jgi:[ribosomal protein S18]-alanine N-acetyltransferase